MKNGRTLQELALELQRQVATRKDFLAPQSKILMQVDERTIKVAGLNGDPMELTPHAHRQVASHLGIPQQYYDRMRTEQPELLARNINTWMHAGPEEIRMVRTLDNRMRAFMSPKFRPLDNFELGEAIIPKLMQIGAKVMSAELTETKMYIKAILPDLSSDLPEGAVWGTGHTQVAEYTRNSPGKVVAAVTISNSDVGAGSLRIEPSVFTTWCTNLAVLIEMAMRKYHVGRRNDAAEDLTIYRDVTRQADDKAFWLKVQDVTAAAFDRKVFEAAVAQIKDASLQKIVSTDLTKVVEMAVKQLDLPELAGNGILSMLARGGDLSKWGLSSAITAIANDTENYEVATFLEHVGGEVLAMKSRDWDLISNAA